MASRRTTRVSASVYPLTPRQVNGWNESTDETRLFLIPVVCVRYHWQFSDFNLEVNREDTTWDSLFSWFANEFGMKPAPAVGPGTRHPDPEQFRRIGANAAMMLEGAAGSVGMRVVMGFDGKAQVHDQALAEKAYQATQGQEWHRVAGHPTNQPMPGPETIVFSFPWFVDHVPVHQRRYTISKDTGLRGGKGTQSIECTHYADFTENSATPANDAKLQALADAIVLSVKNAVRRSYDYTHAGWSPITPGGYDDLITIEMHAKHAEPPRYSTVKLLQDAAGDEFATTSTPSTRRPRQLACSRWAPISAIPNYATRTPT